MKAYHFIPVGSLQRYWRAAEDGIHPLPWNTPPVIDLVGVGSYDIRSLVAITVTNTCYLLQSYSEFYRLMNRDGHFKYVHPTGRDEIILTVFGTYINPALELNPNNVIDLFGKR